VDCLEILFDTYPSSCLTIVTHLFLLLNNCPPSNLALSHLFAGRFSSTHTFLHAIQMSLFSYLFDTHSPCAPEEKVTRFSTSFNKLNFRRSIFHQTIQTQQLSASRNYSVTCFSFSFYVLNFTHPFTMRLILKSEDIYSFNIFIDCIIDLLFFLYCSVLL
jgi:hypothetical protein